MTITSVHLKKLFGNRDASVEFDAYPPITYVFGENGSGKSTVLKLLAAIFDPARRSDLLYNFDLEEAAVEMLSGEKLSLEWRESEVAEQGGAQQAQQIPGLKLAQFHRKAIVNFTLEQDGQSFTGSFIAPPEDLVAPLLRRQLLQWRDQGEEIEPDAMARFVCQELGVESFEHSWSDELRLFLAGFRTILISTERLAREEGEYTRLERTGRLVRRTSSAVAAASKKIGDYVQNEVAAQGRYTNQKDARKIVEDVLTGTIDKSTSVEDVYAVIGNVMNQEERLGKIGLLHDVNRDYEADKAQNIKTLELFQRQEMPAEYIVLLNAIYEERLDNLSKFNVAAKRIEAFQDILSEKYSRKSVVVQGNQGCAIVPDSGPNLDLEDLSSGEQHLFVLFHKMIFIETADEVRPIILIDEPELSLNSSWLRGFTDNLRQIHEANQAQFILATHTPFIATGNRELMSDFKVTHYS